MVKKAKNENAGATGFPKEYWDVNYDEPDEMDNIVNAKEHAEYLRALFKLQNIEIQTVVDLGFGLGVLFKEVLKTFKPYRAIGIEPSQYPFDLLKSKKWIKSPEFKLKLINQDILTWAKTTDEKEKFFDLGLCTSVFQYLSDEEIKEVLPLLSKKIRFLYFSVPTNVEYKRQIDDLEFHDQYAIHRTQEDYLKLLRPHFAIVSSRLLESRFHFNDENTLFTDLLFRI